MLAVGAGKALLDAANIPAALPDGKPDPGLLVVPASDRGTEQFIAAIAKHRHFARQTDPPRV
jgi:catalase